jgi:hypothetical protein
MATDVLLTKLKSSIAADYPEISAVFTDIELLGMLDESREWCAPDCTDEKHVKCAIRTALLVAEEQGLTSEPNV